MNDQWSASLNAGLKKKFESAEYSDLIVKVGNVEHKVHKLIFCTLSKFFEKACSSFKEAETGIIELKHGDVTMLQHLITWFKTGEYCDGAECKSEAEVKASETDEEEGSDDDVDRTGEVWWTRRTESSGWDDEIPDAADDADDKPAVACQHDILFDIQMFALADFYDVEALRKQIAERLPIKIERILPSHRYGPLSRPKEAAKATKTGTSKDKNDRKAPDDVEQVMDFCEAVRQVYTSTPERERALRDIVVRETVDRYLRLAAFDDFLDLLVELPIFNKNMAKDVGKMLRAKNNKVCGACNRRVNGRPCPCSKPRHRDPFASGDWEWIPRIEYNVYGEIVNSGWGTDIND